jgi:hypothetical protein
MGTVNFFLERLITLMILLNGWKTINGLSQLSLTQDLRSIIEQTKKEIEEYSKPCDRRVAQGRTAHREFLKKKLKKMKAQLEELEDEETGID